MAVWFQRKSCTHTYRQNFALNYLIPIKALTVLYTSSVLSTVASIIQYWHVRSLLSVKAVQTMVSICFWEQGHAFQIFEGKLTKQAKQRGILCQMALIWKKLWAAYRKLSFSIDCVDSLCLLTELPFAPVKLLEEDFQVCGRHLLVQCTLEYGGNVQLVSELRPLDHSATEVEVMQFLMYEKVWPVFILAEWGLLGPSCTILFRMCL